MILAANLKYPGSDKELQAAEAYGQDKMELVSQTTADGSTIAGLKAPGACSITVQLGSKDEGTLDTVIQAELVSVEPFQLSRLEPGRKKRPRVPNTSHSSFIHQYDFVKSSTDSGKMSPPKPFSPISTIIPSSQLLRPLLPISSSSMPSVTSSMPPVMTNTAIFHSDVNEVSRRPSAGIAVNVNSQQRLDGLDLLAQRPYLPIDSGQQQSQRSKLPQRSASVLVDAAIQIETADAMRNLALNPSHHVGPSPSTTASHATIVAGLPEEAYSASVQEMIISLRAKYPQYESDKQQREMMFEEVAMHLAAFDMESTQQRQ
ncbi:hypothetical protein HDU67_009917 [Dinochytrium kinnereticum]|nr:hypothetical protein HDU67_009917 [Dinochytrium kinnereticum]